MPYPDHRDDEFAGRRDFRERLPEIMEAARKKRSLVFITDRRKPDAVLMPVEEYEAFIELLEAWAKNPLRDPERPSEGLPERQLLAPWARAAGCPDFGASLARTPLPHWPLPSNAPTRAKNPHNLDHTPQGIPSYLSSRNLMVASLLPGTPYAWLPSFRRWVHLQPVHT
jgi:prevent-host-death family protein